MEINIYNRNRALAVTIVVHITVVLLMLLSFKGCTNLEDMETANGGVMVSFGELDAGGGDQSIESTSPPVENPVDDPTPTKSNPDVNPNPVETSDQSDLPEVNKNKEKEKNQKKEPSSLDERLKKKLAGLKDIAKGNKDGTSGDGRKPGTEGDPNAKDGGPGGQGRGLTGSGEGLILAGFGKGPIPQPENKSQFFEKIRIEFCVDKKGNLISYKSDPSCKGCGSNKYLEDLTIKALKQIKFTPTSSAVLSRNCGSFIVDYQEK
jgi:hypothetical protein